jgi:hypothetical protein
VGNSLPPWLPRRSPSPEHGPQRAADFSLSIIAPRISFVRDVWPKAVSHEVIAPFHGAESQDYASGLEQTRGHGTRLCHCNDWAKCVNPVGLLPTGRCAAGSPGASVDNALIRLNTR